MKGVESSARSDIASSVISEAFSTSSSLTVPEQRLLVDILLCAGAKGDPVARILAQVVRAGHRSVAKLLVKYGANLCYKNAEALRVAVAADNLDMLSTLLRGRITEEVASSIVDETPHTCGDDRTYSILSLLIDEGANGPPLDRALVRAVQRKSNKTIGLLLDHQVNINIEGAQPLRMAVTEGDVPMLNLLLSKGRPHPRSMQLILPLVPRSSLQLRLVMTESIINAAGQDRIAVSILNDALLQALRRPSQQEVDQFLIPLVDVLITAGASHGAKGSEVNQALIDAIEERSIDKILVQSLLEKVDLEYLGGRALATAMRLSTR
ncbi:MAG: hypothetical protein Q9217_003342 [Psora testacea]